MRLSASGAVLVDTARAHILAALEMAGPMTMSELPRRWPVTRPLVRHLVETMVEEGEVERVEGTAIPGHPDLRITALGRARLRAVSVAAD